MTQIFPPIVLVNWTFLRLGPRHDTGYFTDNALLLFMVRAKIISLAKRGKAIKLGSSL